MFLKHQVSLKEIHSCRVQLEIVGFSPPWRWWHNALISSCGSSRARRETGLIAGSSPGVIGKTCLMAGELVKHQAFKHQSKIFHPWIVDMTYHIPGNKPPLFLLPDFKEPWYILWYGPMGMVKILAFAYERGGFTSMAACHFDVKTQVLGLYRRLDIKLYKDFGI